MSWPGEFNGLEFLSHWYLQLEISCVLPNSCLGAALVLSGKELLTVCLCPHGHITERLEPVFLTTSPRKTLQVTFPELSISGGLPNFHHCSLLLAWHLLVVEKGAFVLSLAVYICDLTVENLTVTADLQLKE